MKAMILKYVLTLIAVQTFLQTNTQDIWRRPLTISIFKVATQLPGGRVTPIHPGIELGTEFRYNHSAKNQWLQTIKVGGYYHQYSQTALQLYSELNCRRKIFQKISGDA